MPDAEPQLSLWAKIRTLLSVLQPAYWQAMVVVCILYFARFDASFVTLRAKSVSDQGLARVASTAVCWCAHAFPSLSLVS